MYYNLGLYASDRDTDGALDCLEKAVELGFAHRAWLLNDADLRSLHEEPRFQALLERCA